MPIKPENKKRYPADWPQIRVRILNRAGHKCEFCGVPNHQWIERDDQHDNGWFVTLEADTYSVFIILTIAHLDDPIEDCSDENLAAMCQRCHLTYDAPRHRLEAEKTRRAKLNNLELFDG